VIDGRVLDELRFGVLSSDGAKLIADAAKRVFDEADNIKPTVMHALKRDVEADNAAELAKLPDEIHSFKAVLNGQFTEFTEAEMKRSVAPAVLYLKIG
jgi:hypothetical protein